MDAGQKTPIVAVSASVFEEDRAAVLAAGCDDFLRKPIAEEELFATVGQRLGIRYRYQDTPPSMAAPLPSTPLTAQRLASLQIGLRQELQGALVLLDVSRINSIIEGIMEHDPETGAGVKALADSFAYDKLLDLLGPQIEDSGDRR